MIEEGRRAGARNAGSQPARQKALRAASACRVDSVDQIEYCSKQRDDRWRRGCHKKGRRRMSSRNAACPVAEEEKGSVVWCIEMQCNLTET